MSNLGNFLTGVVDRNRKTKEADQVAKAMYQFLDPGKGADGSVGANPLGPKDQWDLMSAHERVARATAFTQAEALKRAQADQEQQSQMRAMQIDEMKQAMGANRALEDALRAAGRENIEVPSTMSATMGQPSAFPPANAQASVSPTPERLLRAVAEMPEAVNSPNFDNVLRAMQAGGLDAEAELYKVIEGKTKTGTPYVTYGKQFAFDPAATTEQRFNAQKDLLSERERLNAERRQKLSAADLLKSYQADMEALSKAWDMPAEERAARRTELSNQIEALRKAEGGDSSKAAKRPKAGDVLKGYRFKGGDPANKANWEPVS